MRSRRITAAATAALVLATGGARAADPAQGKILYQLRCAACHGPQGRGDGAAAGALKPAPRDLVAPGFWEARSAAAVADAIRHGKPGTAMVAYESLLTDQEIDDIVAFLEGLAHR
jgi:mono/diheme cytochrome c family protein